MNMAEHGPLAIALTTLVFHDIVDGLHGHYATKGDQLLDPGHIPYR